MERNHLAVMIHTQIAKYGDKPVLAQKIDGKWETISWKEMGEQIDAVSKALLELDVKENEMVGIFSQNMPQWAIADYGILSIRGASVPIYATNTSKQAEYIVKDAKIKVLFVGSQEQYDNVAPFLKSKNIEKVIVFDSTTKIDKSPKVLYFSDFLEIGKKSKKDKELQKRLGKTKTDDICTLIYTSGTTGDPKGAILTHSNFYSQFNALDQRFPMDENNIQLCFLPLSHAYQRCSDYWVLTHGAMIYYCEDPKKIVDYFGEVRPTYMVGVPRLYEKMYATIYEKLQEASSAKQKLFNWSIETGKKYRYKKSEKKFVSPWLSLQHAIAYKLVLSKIRAILGGRLNFFSAGGAPLAKTIEEFFFAANIFIAQGYGLTETAPMITCNAPGKFKFGTVGTIVPDVEVKFDEDGEILTKGGNLMKGYYNKPKETKAAITSDGWFRTGDIGFLDDEGFLHITDRKKDIIVTAGGKNIAPQNIESTVGKDYYIEQIAVIGDKRKFISALVVPAFAALEEYAKSKKIPFSTHEDLVNNPRIIEMYRKRIDDLSEGHLAHYETIKKFKLLPREFSQDTGEITPTMKIKRKVINERYKDVIDSMYKEN